MRFGFVFTEFVRTKEMVAAAAAAAVARAKQRVNKRAKHKSRWG